MGKIAFVFPGQGSQKVGMGRALFEAEPAARAVFEAADRALGEPLSRLCFEGPDADLKLTANTQPAVLTTSIALLRALDERCDVAAGHSLGEYSAHVCAGTMQFDDAVRLVRLRGNLMQGAVPVGAGAMAAVIGLDREVVDGICRDTPGIVEPVNYNSPGQVVVAGEAEAVRVASATVKERGGKALPLPVSAPFHSSLMRPAEEQLAPRLAQLSLVSPTIPVYANVQARPVATAAAAYETLVQQVSRPVRWEECVRAMVDAGVTLFVEIGPGKVLTGLIGRIAPDTARINVQEPADLEPARAAIRESRGAHV